MKRFFSFMALLALLCSSGWLALHSTTQTQPAVAQSGAGPMEVAVLLDLPDAHTVAPGERLTPHQSTLLAQDLLTEAARPVLRQLEEMQAAGAVASLEWQAERNAFVVQLNDDQAAQSLSQLPGVAALESAANDAACGQGAVAAFAEQLHFFSRQPTEHPARLNATDPSIDVYHMDGDDLGYIWGYTTPNTPVTIRIWRNGALLVERSTTSSTYGSYSLYPAWQNGCGQASGYDWTLLPGDVVEVTAHGSTVSTVVAPLTYGADPLSNIVAGKTEAGRQVEVHLWSNDGCSGMPYNLTVGTDPAGNFAANFTATADFLRNTSTTTYARDANGNSTYGYMNAYGLWYDIQDGYAGGYLPANADFSAQHKRGATVLETKTGKTNYRGYWYAWFTNAILPGDQIIASGGGHTIEYTAPTFQASLNPAANQIGGKTSSNALVMINLYQRSSGDVITACDRAYDCLSGTTDAAGNFNFNSSFNLERGDYAYVYVYDAQGNGLQTNRLSATAIATSLDYNQVSGYWGLFDNQVNIVVKNSGGVVKDTQTTYVDSWDGGFDEWISGDIVAGDIIQVGNGTTTETMTAKSLTGVINTAAKTLSGNASGNILVSYEDFHLDTGYWYDECRVTTASGAYSFDFASAQVGAQDYADIYLSDPNGHYTVLDYVHAFETNVEMNNGYVWGYSALPGVPVNVSLYDGATLVYTKTVTSGNTGYYSVYTPDPLTTGQRVVVDTDASLPSHADITLPNITIQQDVPGQRIYGTAPANSLLDITVWIDYACSKYYWCGRGYSRDTHTDAAGNFSQTFTNMYLDNCEAMLIGGQCVYPEVTYYRPDEHSISKTQPPTPVTADAHEADNTFATAKTYTGRSAHTFHTTDDEDWIKFSVPANKVGQKHYLMTTNLGRLSDTKMDLYDTDGTSLLESNDDSAGYASMIIWTPAAAGDYYIRISPYATWRAANCGATYDFVLAYYQVFLPLNLK
jgi:hypothetical protein